MNSGKVLVIWVAGIATGVLAGILFAPAKGSKTRKRILKKGKTFSVTAKEKSFALLDSAAAEFGKLINEVFFDDKKSVQPEEEVLHESQII